MPVNTEKYKALLAELNGKATLVAVSKTKPMEDIQALYDLGQRDFGENYVQELVDKQAALPKDIRWHFIGHLQSNKVKYIAPFVHLIHGADSIGLLKEINKQGAKFNRVIDCLLQVHIAKEETKFGFDENEINELHQLNELQNVHVTGLMGMASFSGDKDLVRSEFVTLKQLFALNEKMFISAVPPDQTPVATPPVLSMGMSGDYAIALQEGSNMIRIGSALFGERNYSK